MASKTVEEFVRHRISTPFALAFIGPNGSGKSSVAAALCIQGARSDGTVPDRAEIDPETGNLVICLVNPDEISAQIRRARPDLAQREADEMAARYAEARRRELAGNLSDFGFETVGSHPSKLEFLRELKARGYFIAIVFVATESPEINACRVAQRVAAGGHDVDPEKIEPRYHRTLAMLGDYVEVADFAAIYDNSRDSTSPDPAAGPRLLAIKHPGGALHPTDHYPQVAWVQKHLPTLP